MFKELSKMQRRSLFQIFLSTLTNLLIYFVAVVTGIACLLIGQNIVAIVIFSLLLVRVMLDIRANKEIAKIQEVINSLMQMTENLVPNQ
jgi:Flp pilus assembly protein TadB